MNVPGVRSALAAQLHAAGAIAVGTTAFLLIRERYTCTVPTGSESFVFAGLAIAFMLAFVWLVADILSSLARRLAGRALIGSVVVAVLLYSLIAGIAWSYNPTPHDQSADAGTRAILSVFWSAGFLQESGHFSNYSCGY